MLPWKNYEVFLFYLKCWEQASAGGRGGQVQVATEASSIRGGFAAHIEDGIEEKTPGEQDPSSIMLCASKRKDQANPDLPLTALLVPIILNLP